LKANTIAVVSDGSAILGLGNLGPAAALPVMEGKAVLFKKFADIDAFPICLDTQDAEEIIRTVKYLAPSFGGINLEDISAPRCFEIEARLRKELDIPVMHDDQHGAATATLAALINALKLRKLNKRTARVVVNGAGAAGTAIARLLLDYGFKDLIVCDSQGAIYSGRPGLISFKKDLAKVTNKRMAKGGLSEALEGAQIFIGASVGNVLTPEMVKHMDKQPIIFALANPFPEIKPEEAKRAGAFIFASGRSDYPNQINNVLVFPGIFRGALDNGVKKINNQMLIRAAERLAKLVGKPRVDMIIPSPFDKRVVKAVASQIY